MVKVAIFYKSEKLSRFFFAIFRRYLNFAYTCIKFTNTQVPNLQMALKKTAKRRLVVNLLNLPAEIQEAIKTKYPLGFTEAMMRIDKPNGDFFYAVPYSTEETEYLVKIDVKVDGKINDDKDIFGDDIKGGDDELQTEEEENPHQKRDSIAGVYDDDRED